MNDYEQKVAARIERQRARASRLEAEAASRARTADQIASFIPMGQPILVGHHSERRHRRDLERIDSNMRKSIEASKEAEELNRRADNAETSTAVSGDDPDALPKLREKLEEEERRSTNLKAANKLLRSGAPDSEVVVLLDWWPSPIHRLRAFRSLGHRTIPPTNISAEIRRLKGRIEELEKRATMLPKAPEHFSDIEVREEENRVRIFFPAKPSESIRTELKRWGFRWSPTAGAWQAYINANSWYAARKICTAAVAT